MTTGARTVEAQTLLVQMLDPEIRADPYPLFARIRELGPMVLPEMNMVVFSGFAQCDEVLRHPASCSDGMKSAVVQRQIAEGIIPPRTATPGFLFLDPPDHTRLRKLAQQAFSPKVVRQLEPEIVALVDELLDKVPASGELDVVTDLAYPLPVAVICRLLGVPLEDEPQFSRAAALLAQGLDPVMTLTGHASEDADERLQAGEWMRGYLADLVEQRRAAPREDMISALIAAEEDGDQLGADEIVATCNLLLIAGHETTVNLIGNAVQAMLRQPEQWRALAGDPQRANAIVEETLRYDPPVQLVMRIAGADMTIGDRAPVGVRRGDSMLLLLAAAHRDPDVFDRPDIFDPDREDLRHLAFGKGLHFCLGAPLARLEARIALAELARRWPEAHLLGESVYKPNVTLRGLASLPLG
ncbi:cytochrome P450 [Mycolicibacterium canariasense]|uniref:Steroid C26-monooxygenase n=1 Tax=Mycolicibacterium canariasense TaxID=228230 RepID=A0A100WKA4_MYCCR|nr:cytochrome P450 [Mycolicibacterium canariasense]MCV7207269.1 cytochrome P450 [Mycolicibacterium canariasense]ORV06505.1 cytochrome [Mycolicibacterium canariasense]GAS99474.1 cytochrome P450 [Mycolicibacterium canariasense]